MDFQKNVIHSRSDLEYVNRMPSCAVCCQFCSKCRGFGTRFEEKAGEMSRISTRMDLPDLPGPAHFATVPSKIDML